MKVIFTEQAIKQYMEWQFVDKKTLKRINELIKDIQRNGFLHGIGKPEALRGTKEYSRKIDDKNRRPKRQNALVFTPILTLKTQR